MLHLPLGSVAVSYTHLSAAVEQLAGPTYFERVQQSEEFRVFESEFTDCVGGFRQSLNDIVTKSTDGLVDSMLGDVDALLKKTRNPLHLLDMLPVSYTHLDVYKRQKKSLDMFILNAVVTVGRKQSCFSD